MDATDITKCVKCEANEVEKYEVRAEAPSRTFNLYEPFWDADSGLVHDHDDNLVETRYRCSNGHTWLILSKKRCQAHGCKFGGILERIEE